MFAKVQSTETKEGASYSHVQGEISSFGGHGYATCPCVQEINETNIQVKGRRPLDLIVFDVADIDEMMLHRI